MVNAHDEQVYCLPDGYEVQDASLEDIKVPSPSSVICIYDGNEKKLILCGMQFVLHPHYTQDLVARLDSITVPSYALDGSPYYPGVVGLNNIKNNDYINAVVQALAHVRPLRDFFLLEENYLGVITAFHENS